MGSVNFEIGSSSSQSVLSVLKSVINTPIDNPKAILVTVEDSNGNKVANLRKLNLYKIRLIVLMG